MKTKRKKWENLDMCNIERVICDMDFSNRI